MPIPIQMPALSPTMESGNLAKWHVKEGDTVEAGDVIAEIETDKATMEVEAVDEGTIGKIVIAEGTDDVPVNTVIAILLEEGEDATAIAATPAPAAPKVAESLAQAKAPTPAPAPAPTPKMPTPAAPVQSGTRVKASPLARRIAANKGLDIATIQGSGPNGRIVKRDVENAQPSAAPVAAQAAISTDAPYETVKLSTMRKTIAKRLSESKQTVPHFYLTVDANIDKLLAARVEVNAQLDGEKISVNDFIIKAVALALKKVPDANVQYAGDHLLKFSRSDVSVAVAIEGGLITPVVRDAANKGLLAIAREVKDLAGRAREGKLMPEDYQGGTFSISNLGMFGVKEFSAVINPPQAAILAVGAGEKRPVVIDGKLEVATLMSMTLSCDHRAIDGAVGATYLQALKGFLENPASMLL